MFAIEKLNDVLQQDVSRKEFLRYIGIAILSVIGVASMLNNLQSAASMQVTEKPKSTGYGASAYGR